MAFYEITNLCVRVYIVFKTGLVAMNIAMDIRCFLIRTYTYFNILCFDSALCKITNVEDFT